MKVCRQCGQSVQDVETYCPRCGSNKLADENVQRQPNRVPRAAAGRPVAPNGVQVNNGGPNQHRHIQQAPAGYRNPNAVIQNPNQGNPGYNNKAAGFNNQGFNDQDDDFDNGFGMVEEEQPVQNTKKGLLGKGKQPKAPKTPKMPKAPANQQMRQQVDQHMGQQIEQQVDQQIGNSNNVITFKDWLILFLKMAIPVYNIIIIVKALTNPYENPTLKNYFKASIILAGIVAALTVIGSIVITTLFSAMMF